MSSRRKKIPLGLRASLLAQARNGCFAHRLSWHHRVTLDRGVSKKSLPLDIHHVRFVSAGGDDGPENLAPLCALCHRIIHDTGLLGHLDATPENIRAAWNTWTSFRDIEVEQAVGLQSPVKHAVVDLATYSLRPRFAIGAEVNYMEARTAILNSTVGRLCVTDPYFPFPHPSHPTEIISWTLTCDRCGPPPPWNVVPASEYLLRTVMPIQLIAPIVMLLDRRDHPVLYGNEEQRTM